MKGILQLASLKLAKKREEVSFVHLVPYIQTMLKTYASEIKKNHVTAGSSRESEKHNNVTDQITKIATKAL